MPMGMTQDVIWNSCPTIKCRRSADIVLRHKRQALLQHANSDQINAISELTLNVTFPSPPRPWQKLQRHKEALRHIARRKHSVTRRRADTGRGRRQESFFGKSVTNPCWPNIMTAAKELLMVPTADYNNLVNYYKGKITESALLNKAGRLAAERDLILKNPRIPSSVAVAMTQPKAQEVRRLTKRIRTGGMSAPPQPEDEDLLLTPLENKLDRILRATTEKTLKQQTPWVPLTRRRKLPKTPKKQLVKPEQTSTESGWLSSVKRGALKGLGQSMGVRVSGTSDNEDASATRRKKKKPTPKAVKRLRAAPGWEDWTEGKQLRRALLSEYEESDED